MLKIVPSNKFRKDLKLALRRGYKIELLEEVVNKLAEGVVLEPKYKDHDDFISSIHVAKKQIMSPKGDNSWQLLAALNKIRLSQKDSMNCLTA